MFDREVKLKLVGNDGNAFVVLGAARHAAQKAKVPKDLIDIYLKEAMSGDYSKLLATTCEWFEVS